MASGFEAQALSFLQHYGYAALFVLLALETAMILHFVPGELIVSGGTAALAHDPLSLALVIAVSTAGATAGAWLLFWATRRGGRRLVEKHARFFHASPERVERLERLFRRPAGEVLVFVGRLLPIARAVVSIPAGLARMDTRKFLVYSAAGSAILNAAIAYTTYAASRNPQVIAWIDEQAARWPLWLASLLVAGLVAWWVWRRRHLAPEHVVAPVWRVTAAALVALGVLILAAAVVAPDATFRALTWVATDAAAWALSAHVAPLAFVVAVALGLTGVGLLALGLTDWVKEGIARARRAGLRRD